MNTSTILRHFLQRGLRLLFSLVLVTIAGFGVFAQCPQAKSTAGCGNGTSNLSFPPNQTVYIDIDLNIREPELSQIRAGFDSWNQSI